MKKVLKSVKFWRRNQGTTYRCFLVILVAIFSPRCKLNPTCMESFNNLHLFLFRYAYTAKGCEMFTYGGCQGSGNNFDTVEECQRICS
ncbi:hypothetical protein ABMA28_011237 [Loxostege sticticalis]|uniref:BPTI/Kunitz inhibitor domain-containing protein n=1 Tax=Loxostege sticticalis TaxID=481309 RepID=A0ABD0SAJ3_LOXSC